jgi:hypothetical protein
LAQGRVVLIGGAPKMGEGGCLATEDATLFAELSQSSKSVEKRGFSVPEKEIVAMPRHPA